MNSYDERLDRFGRDRTLIRLAPPVVNRRAALCDACGSHQPRVLHALKDRAADRYVFVGQSCLQALTERGALGRRALRARTEQAYEEELDLRHADEQPDAEASPSASSTHAAGTLPTDRSLPASGAMLLVAVLRPSVWTAVLELVGAERDTCLIVPLGDELPSFAGAALPLAHLQELAERAGRVCQRLQQL